MNTPLTEAKRRLGQLERCVGKIKRESSRVEMREAVLAAVGRMGYGAEESLGEQSAPVVPSPAVASVTVAENAKTVVLEPVSDHAAELPGDAVSFVGNEVVNNLTGERRNVPSAPLVFSKEEPAIEGDVNGSSGTFYAETVEVAAPVEKVDGWPVSAKLVILGLSPNRRMLRGHLRLGEAFKVVSVERKVGVQTGAEVTAKLMMAGQSPLYRVVA